MTRGGELGGGAVQTRGNSEPGPRPTPPASPRFDPGTDGPPGIFATPLSDPAPVPQPPRLSKRRQVRERVLQAVYAYEASEDPVEHVIDTLIRPTFGEDKTYLRFAERLFLKTADAKAEADVLIDRHIENWDLNRLARTDRYVLWMAITELLYFEDIPPKVTLNEAVEVARVFGTDKSPAFVNGVLDAVLRELEGTDRMTKTGRGLVNTSKP